MIYLDDHDLAPPSTKVSRVDDDGQDGHFPAPEAWNTMPPHVRGGKAVPETPELARYRAMERLVRDGRAEWTTTRGKPALRLTAFGRAMLRHPQTAEAVQ